MLQRDGAGMVAQSLRHEERLECLGEAGDVLGYIDERDGEIAGRMQDGHSKRAGQNDIPGRDSAVLPQHDRPRQQADGQAHRYGCVQRAQSLEVEQTKSAR